MDNYEQNWLRAQQRWGNLKVRIMQEINALSGPHLKPQQRSQYANGVARLNWVLAEMRKSPDVLAHSVRQQPAPAIDVPHQQDERYEIKDEDKNRALRTLAALVNEETPEGMGFAVFMFDFGPGGTMWYVSNAERGDVAESMREWIKQTGGQ